MNAKVSRSIVAGICAGFLGLPANAGEWCTDVDGDGVVGITDFLIALAGLGLPGPADIDMSGTVDCIDLALITDYFGPCPSPAPGSNDLFDQVVVVDATTPEAASLGLLVSHVYATGASVAVGNLLMAVEIQSLTATAGTLFFQETEFGSESPPDSFDFPMSPALPYDTFVTMTSLADGMVIICPGFIESTTSMSGMWFSPNLERIAQDIGDGQAGVLIAQITMPVDDPTDLSYDGTLTLFTSLIDGGSLSGIDVPVSFTGSVATPGDLDGDGVVGIGDFLDLLAAWGPCADPCPPLCYGDIDGDCTVGILDFLILLANWTI